MELETSNIAKYHVGQRVEGVGEKGDVSGIVMSVTPGTAGARMGSAAGPGRITTPSRELVCPQHRAPRGRRSRLLRGVPGS